MDEEAAVMLGEKGEEALDIRLRLSEFLRTYRDRGGELKYVERIKEMVSLSSRSLVVDWTDLYLYDTRLAQELLRNPEEFLERASEAIRDAVRTVDYEYAETVDKFFLRIRGVGKARRLRELRSDLVGKMIMVEGILVRATPVKQMLVRAKLRHRGPEGEHEFYWPPEGEMHEEFELPAVCPVCNRGGSFKLVADESTYVDWQKVVIQEKPEEIPPGQLPRSIEVILLRDLVDQARPGDRVTVTGVLKIKASSSALRRARPPVFDLYIDANYIEVSQKVLEEVAITKEDEERIKELARDPWIRQRIVASIAPAIYGHWDIKEAIALALFGGVPKHLRDGTRVRGDIHVLLIGDPGTAKSLTYSEHILVIDEDGLIDIRPIGELVDEYMERFKDRVVIRGETEHLPLENIGVDLYTIAISPRTHRPEVKRVKALIRHRAPRRIVVLKTRHGRKALITRDHSLMGLDESTSILAAVKPYDALRKNVRLPALRSLAPFRKKIAVYMEIGGRTARLSEDLGYLIGFLLGNGTLGRDPFGEYMEIKTASLKAARRLAWIARHRLSMHPEIHVEKEAGLRIYRLIVRDREFVEWVKSNCLAKTIRNNMDGRGRALEKKIPRIAFNAPIGFIKALISGLIDSAGSTASSEAESREEVGGSLVIRAESRLLAYGVSTLLAILGLEHKISHIYTRHRGGKAPLINIHVSAPTWSRWRKGQAASSPSAIQKGIQLEMQSLVETASQSTMIAWDTVESVEETDIREIEPEHHEYVYDISVEDHENFAGGIGLLFLHNSQLLQFVAKIAPRGLYTSGKGSSAAGLTAAVLKDKSTGEYYLEAGALVLADGGVACIDEFDKMRDEDRSAIHEVLEQQSVSIAKAGIVARLNARATVIAAGNPKYGRFVGTNIADNVTLPPTILSRFDLIFVMKDVPRETLDSRLARHIMHVHREAEQIRPEIPPEMLKKYISYARRNVKPRLTPQAAKLLEEFFVSMRMHDKPSGEAEERHPIPITARQLEALVRLAEAHAKMALKSSVDEEDALEAIRLMHAFLDSVGKEAEGGPLDADILSTGISTRARNKMLRLKELIRELSSRSGEGKTECIHLKEIEAVAVARLNLSKDEVARLLRKMAEVGDLFEKRLNCYVLVD